MSKHTNTITLAKALRVIARDMESADGLPQIAILEAADRLEGLDTLLRVINGKIQSYDQLKGTPYGDPKTIYRIQTLIQQSLNHEDQ